MSNSPPDGGQGPSAPDQPPDIYNTRKGAAKQDGTDFEIKMCALVFLRAVQSNSSFPNFRIKSNYEQAGSFDDIVFSYGSPGNEQNILVQLKISKRPINLDPPEKKSKKKSLESHLDSPEKNISLESHFQSLVKAKTSQHFENCTYVFLTNADVKLASRVENVDSAAKTLLCTAWKPDNVRQVDRTDDICKGFMNDTGAADFVNRLLIFRNQCGPKYLDELINQELIKMCNGFVPQCQKIQQKFVEEIKSWWEEDTKAALDKDWEQWTKLEAQLLGQNTLLKQIKFCDDTLSDLEKKVLGCGSDIVLLNSDSTESQIACSKVYQTFTGKDYLRVLFTDASEPQKSQNKLFKLWSQDVCNVLVITDVTNCCKNLGENITDYKVNSEKQNKKIVIVSSSDAKTLGLLQDSVDKFGTEFIKSTFGQLDENSKHLVQDVRVVFQGKKILLGEIMVDKILEGGLLQYVLTSPEVQIGKSIPACNGEYIPRTLCKKFEVKKEIADLTDIILFLFYNAEDIDTAAIRNDRLKEEKWQQWREVLTRKNKINRVHDAKWRRELDEAISWFQCCVEEFSEDPVHFIRPVQKYSVFSLYWMYSHGSTDNLLKCIVGESWVQDDFRTFIENFECWRVKEEDIVRKEIKTVIVAGESGSGKTALLRQVASKMKELYPHRWIIYVDLNKHSEILRKVKKLGIVTSENVVDLLSKAANLDDTELGKKLLKYYLSEKILNICVLFDAFDEISPSYTKTVLDILSFFRSYFGRQPTMWVASRNSVKEELENKLESKVFNIEPLSDQEQLNFLSKLWGEEKAAKLKAIVDGIPRRNGVHLGDNPLHLRMICEVLGGLNLQEMSKSMESHDQVDEMGESENDLTDLHDHQLDKMGNSSNDSTSQSDLTDLHDHQLVKMGNSSVDSTSQSDLTDLHDHHLDKMSYSSYKLKEINLIDLYDQFIEMKLDIYLKEKVSLSDSSAQIPKMKKDLHKAIIDRHMKCSLVALDVIEELHESDQSSIKKEVQKICEDIDKGNEYLGIIDGVVAGKPHFIHRSFAEHFAAKWLVQNAEEYGVLMPLLSMPEPNHPMLVRSVQLYTNSGQNRLTITF